MKIEWFFIWTNLNPLHQRMHCAKFGLNWPSGSGEEDGIVKSLRKDGPTTDNRRSEKLTWAFSSDELKNNVDKSSELKKKKKTTPHQTPEVQVKP